jgi:primosomal protein N' (replication factor Y)
VLGPADCIKSRLKDRMRRHIVVKTPLVEGVGQRLLECVRATNVPRGINVAIDVDAHDMM